MKRVGNLFQKAFTPESLYQAWLDASKNKKTKRATLEFSKNLAKNLDDLHREIHSGTYKPLSYVEFKVYEPKERIIYAPSFRDLVVQHAIYRLTYPIFNAGFIDQSYACRKGKGTHAAADYAQDALRRSDPESYVLQLDIRKFFYRIDREILRKQIERKIKDVQFVDLMMKFAEYGSPIGIPIGNLLSQMYALIYLNPLDHFIKRKLGAKKYCRYVDDFIIFGWSRERCNRALGLIQEFLRLELHLELSKYSLHKVKRGVNFVGYRTWQKRRFIRKHSMYKFSKSIKKENLESAISILGHALKTSGFYHLMKIARTNNPKFYSKFPWKFQKKVSCRS